MKKLVKSFLFVLVAMAVCAIPSLVHAQDSTAVAGGATESVITTIISALELKWPIIATVGTCLFFLSEALAGIPSLKANSVYQLVSHVLSGLFGKKS